MVGELAPNARYTGSIPALGIIFPHFDHTHDAGDMTGYALNGC